MSTLKWNMVLNSWHVKLECHFQQSRELSRQIQPSSNLLSKTQALTQPAAALSLSNLSPNLAQKALNGFCLENGQHREGEDSQVMKQRGTGRDGSCSSQEQLLSPHQRQVFSQKQVKCPFQGTLSQEETQFLKENSREKVAFLTVRQV